MEKEASVLERDHVHSVYEKIAPYFSDARYKAWPKVQEFLLAQEPGSLIADIVVHHFSTKERRIRAIKEMARILRTGGRIMIYVWAMEQKRRKFGKQDIFVPWNSEPLSPSHVSSHGAVVEPKKLLHRPAAANQRWSSMDSAVKPPRNSASFVGGKEMFYKCFDKSLRWNFFSKSLDSVFDLGDRLSFNNNQFPKCSVNSSREKLFEQKEPGDSTKGSPAMFAESRRNSEDDSLGIAESPLPRHFSHLCGIDSESTSQQPPSEQLIRDCSRVSLPDLVSRHKELPGRKQSKNNFPIKQVDSYKPLNKNKAGVSLQETDYDLRKGVPKNPDQTPADSACLRYYHVFRKGELVDLIDHHIPELHVVQAYFDHANWCVVAEKVNVWKI
ncbi:probable tRNA methyltransferase 9B isoform X2 [Pleurodeles waltl]|uniref:probable tRNA methyltransferase 9B isoform X2 n=1 Tax=Pleurodeles waltl TaxID=8319 RepID=UPI0037093B6A